jgi:hypothetical protein
MDPAWWKNGCFTSPRPGIHDAMQWKAENLKLFAGSEALSSLPAELIKIYKCYGRRLLN